MLLLVKEARFCDDSTNVGRDSDVDSDSDGDIGGGTNASGCGDESHRGPPAYKRTSPSLRACPRTVTLTLCLVDACRSIA